MLSRIQHYKEIAKELKQDYPKMSDFERLSLAIQIERNQLLENGLSVSTTDANPSALEAIAICLGYTGIDSQTITEVLKSRLDD